MSRSYLSGLCAILIVLSTLPHGGATVHLNEYPHKETITYAQPYGFSAFSPFSLGPNGIPVWFSAVYSGLLKRSSANNRDWTNDLAKAMPTVSFDRLTFTFELRDNLIFSNGDPLTVSDVAFSFKMALAPAINKLDYGKYVGFMDNNSLQVISNSSLSLTLLTQFSFPYDLMSFTIVPRTLYEQQYSDCLTNEKNCNFNNRDGSNSISIGPYMVTSLSSDKIVLNRNLNWYEPNWSASYREDITLVFLKIATKADAISELTNQTIKIMDSRYIPGLNELRGISGIKETFVGDPKTFEIALNNLNPYFGTGMQIPKTLTEDPNNKTFGFENARLLRHALSAIVDRENAVTRVMEVLGEPAATNMPSASLGWDPTVKPDAYNLTRAQEILTSLGFNYTDLGVPDAFGNYSKFFFNVTVAAPYIPDKISPIPLSYLTELPKLGIGVSKYTTKRWCVIDAGWISIPCPVPRNIDGYGSDLIFLQRSWDLDWNPGDMFSRDGSCITGDCNNIYNFDLGENMTKLAQHVRDYLGELDFDARLKKVSIVQQDLAYYLPTLGILYPQSHLAWIDDVYGVDPLLILTGAQEWYLVYQSYTINGGPPPTNNPSRSDEILRATILFAIIIGIVIIFKKTPFKE